MAPKDALSGAQTDALKEAKTARFRLHKQIEKKRTARAKDPDGQGHLKP
ncbi:MAG: hypothetical protein HFE45_04630 [Oscillospiraceae bacterium]|jgi:hypothetical protein|nr:hypothetical protein [Oscillospiraceae bacterium]